MLPIKTKMVVDMELQEAKDAVLQLMKDKEKIESNLRALKEILDSVCILFYVSKGMMLLSGKYQGHLVA